MKNLFIFFLILITFQTSAQIGRRFPSERKEITDPVTGHKLIFLTSTPAGDSKIYQTHNQWTSDGQWLIFRSNRARNEALAVNEKTGDIVQVTEGGYTGMLNVGRLSMNLYFLRYKNDRPNDTARRRPTGPLQVIEVNLAAVLDDSKAGKMKSADTYQRVCGTIPEELDGGGDLALDGDEQWVYFKTGKKSAAKY